MKIRETINKHIPTPIALVALFLCLNFSIFMFLRLIFSLVQVNIFHQDFRFTEILILLTVLLSYSFSIILLVRFLQMSGETFSITNSYPKRSLQKIFAVILILIGFLIFVNYEIIYWWMGLYGETTYDLLPWPFPLFQPEGYEIPYLIFYSLFFVLIQPLFDELLFRRILLGRLLRRGFNPVYAVFLSTLAFSVSFFFYILVELTLNDLVWFILTKFAGGLILGGIFVWMGQIRYSTITSSIVNVSLLLLFLSENHFEFIPYRSLILSISQIIILIGFLLVFYVYFQTVLDGKMRKTIKDARIFLQTISWPRNDNIKQYWGSILILVPIFPLGGVVFVDHFILYSDHLAMVLEYCITLLFLGFISFFLYYSVRSSLSTIPENKIKTMRISLNLKRSREYSRKNSSLKSILRGIMSYVTYSFLRIFQEIKSHLIFLILLLGIISPFYILSIVSLTKVDIIIVLKVFIDTSVFIAQNPFFTFQRVVTKIRSNVVVIGSKTEIFNQLFIFQQAPGKWNFLPDTYMTSSADWIHGLLTVSVWFGIIFLYYFLLKRSRDYPIKAAIGAIILVVLNFFWILLAMGLGSISEEGEPSGMPSLQDMSLLVNLDIQIKEFLILPLGLSLFLLAAIVILLQALFKRRKDSQFTTVEQ